MIDRITPENVTQTDIEVLETIKKETKGYLKAGIKLQINEIKRRESNGIKKSVLYLYHILLEIEFEFQLFWFSLTV